MGRPVTRTVPFQPLLQVGQRHREIMRRIVAGQSQAQISRELKITQSRLSIICNSPLFKRELTNLQTKVEDKFVEERATLETRVSSLQHKALDILDDILSKDKIGELGVPLRLKRDAANDVLGMGELKKKTHDEGMSDFAKFISDAFKVAQSNREKRIEKNVTDIIDAEFKEAAG